MKSAKIPKYNQRRHSLNIISPNKYSTNPWYNPYYSDSLARNLSQQNYSGNL